MIAKICWICLMIVGVGFAMAYCFGICKDRLEISSTAVPVDHSDRFITPAAQRYVVSRSTHWKDVILTR